MHHISARTKALGGARWLHWQSRDTKSVWTANLTPSSRPDCDLFFAQASQGTQEDTYIVARGGGISFLKVLIGFFRSLGRNVEKMGAAPVKGRRHPSPAPQAQRTDCFT